MIDGATVTGSSQRAAGATARWLAGPAGDLDQHLRRRSQAPTSRTLPCARHQPEALAPLLRRRRCATVRLRTNMPLARPLRTVRENELQRRLAAGFAQPPTAQELSGRSLDRIPAVVYPRKSVGRNIFEW